MQQKCAIDQLNNHHSGQYNKNIQTNAGKKKQKKKPVHGHLHSAKNNAVEFCSRNCLVQALEVKAQFCCKSVKKKSANMR